MLLQRDGAQTRNCGEEKKRNVLEELKDKKAEKKIQSISILVIGLNCRRMKYSTAVFHIKNT